MASEKSATILLGTAAKTINPPVGMLMVGYGNGRANTGVALDLFARAAVFGTVGSEKPAAAMVVLDTLGVAPEFVAKVRKGAAEKIPGLDPAAVMVCATHTHSGPTLSARQFGNDDPGKINAYADQTVNTAAEALAAAWKARSEMRAKIGRTEVRIGHNRRVVDPEGVATNVWPDLEGVHSGFFNPNVRILMFEDARTGKPRLLYSFYACHPVVLGPQNLKVSADYPGYFVRAVEAALPGCMAVHVTAGAGNINPRDAINKDAEKAKPAGDALAKAVLEEMAYLRPINPSPIVVRTETLMLPLRPIPTRIIPSGRRIPPTGRISPQKCRRSGWGMWRLSVHRENSSGKSGWRLRTHRPSTRRLWRRTRTTTWATCARRRRRARADTSRGTRFLGRWSGGCCRRRAGCSLS